MTEQDTPRIEVTIAAPADTVWRSLRDPDLVRRWHGWHFDGLDDEVRLIYVQADSEDAAEHVLVVQGGDRFSLEESAGSTVVRLTRAPHGDDPEWDAYYDDVTEGWKVFLEQLRFAIERHDLAERRTVFLDGPLAEPVGTAEALGLAEASAQPVGSRWSATTATGDALSGTVWSAREHSWALTVDQLGDGLVVLGDAPPSGHRPHGGAMVVLTTYGLDDEAFGALEQRWTAWFERTRRPVEEPSPS